MHLGLSKGVEPPRETGSESMNRGDEAIKTGKKPDLEPARWILLFGKKSAGKIVGASIVTVDGEGCWGQFEKDPFSSDEGKTQDTSVIPLFPDNPPGSPTDPG